MKKYLGIFILICGFYQAVVSADDLASYDNLPPSFNIKKLEETINNSGINNSKCKIINDYSINNTNKGKKHLDLKLLQIPSGRPLEGEIIFKENEITFNATDPLKDSNPFSFYPGQRGPNQLIIYTPAFGERTGTNEFGTEAIVEKNMVVRLNGADSIIPKNGFVISGHGKAKNWILKNIQIGSKVYIDYSTGSIRVFLTPESLIFAAKSKLKEVNEIIEHYQNIDVLYNNKKALEYIENAKDYLRKAEKKPEKAQHYITEAVENLNNAIKNAIPYNKNELKGVWLRPIENNSADIEKSVERIYKSGITDIFLETYFHGKTIYPSQYLKSCGLIPQRSEFIGFDPLEIWIKEAHKRGMKVHIWFEAFYVGNDNPFTTPNHILSLYPEWSNRRFMNYETTEPQPSLSEHNGYFLDPANSLVQEHLLCILKEIIDTYKPDGINLDYIRYPQTVDSSYSNYAVTNWGYTQTAREDFKRIYGIDPINIKYGTYDWDLWTLYRQNKITEFVKETKKLTQKYSIPLTAVIFPDLEKSKQTKMQNWHIWSKKNYVDGLTPLLLTCDKNTADLLIKDVIKNTSPDTNIYPGLFVTFMGGDAEDLLFQLHKIREVNSKGAVIFDYAHLHDKYINAVTVRIFNKNYDVKEFNIKTNENYKPQVKLKEKTKKEKTRKSKNNLKLYGSYRFE